MWQVDNLHKLRLKGRIKSRAAHPSCIYDSHSMCSLGCLSQGLGKVCNSYTYVFKERNIYIYIQSYLNLNVGYYTKLPLPWSLYTSVWHPHDVFGYRDFLEFWTSGSGILVTLERLYYKICPYTIKPFSTYLNFARYSKVLHISSFLKPNYRIHIGFWWSRAM